MPDTFDGRFELLVLHVFMVFHRLKPEEGTKDFMQALFDVTFTDMDQTLPGRWSRRYKRTQTYAPDDEGV